MDYNEFAEKIKAKYPAYADMDNRDLAQKMVAKFPQYSDVTFGEPQGSALQSAASAIESVTNPVFGALGQASDAAAKGFSRLATGSEVPAKMAQKAVGAVTGGIQKAGEWVAEKGGELGVNPYIAATAGMVAANAPYFAIPSGGPVKAGPGMKAFGRGAARLGEAASGVAARDIEGLFNKPSTLFKTGSKEEAGKAIGEAKLSVGINPGVTEDLTTLNAENVGKALSVGATGKESLLSIAESGTGTAEQIGDALKYVSDEIKGRLSNGKDASELINIQNHLNGMLDKVAPAVQKAREEFAPLAQRNKFLQLAPRNKNQTVSRANLFYLGSLLAGAGGSIGGSAGAAGAVLAGAAARAPITTGLATVGASLASRISSGVINSPAFRRGVYSQLVDRLTVGKDQNGQ